MVDSDFNICQGVERMWDSPLPTKVVHLGAEPKFVTFFNVPMAMHAHLCDAEQKLYNKCSALVTSLPYMRSESISV